MASKQSTARKPNSQPQPQLTIAEVQRLVEKIAVALENDSNNIALLILLFDHLEQRRTEPVLLSCAIDTIKDCLFARTSEAGDAQREFQADAYKNRGKLLQWPYERKGAA